MKKSVMTNRQERELLGLRLDYQNAVRCCLRATKLGMQDVLERAEYEQRKAEKALLKFVLPYARLSGEFTSELRMLHGEDANLAINEINAAISRKDTEYMRGYLYALEFSEPVNFLMEGI